MVAGDSDSNDRPAAGSEGGRAAHGLSGAHHGEDESGSGKG